MKSLTFFLEGGLNNFLDPILVVTYLKDTRIYFVSLGTIIQFDTIVPHQWVLSHAGGGYRLLGRSNGQNRFDGATLQPGRHFHAVNRARFRLTPQSSVGRTLPEPLAAQVYPAVFERNETDCSAPGTLVPLVEGYYLSSVDALVQSARKKKS